MKKWIVMAAVLLLGCAGQQVGESGVANTQADSESRQRARAFTELANAYLARAQYKVALDELRKAITADNRYGPAYNIYGLIYMELAEDKLAEENFRRAIELDRSDSEARNNYGWFLCTRGRYDEGLEQFSAALRNPLYAQPEMAMTNAGQCAERKGDLALAEANLMKSLKPQAVIDRTKAILEKNQKERRKREIQRQIEALRAELNSLEQGSGEEKADSSPRQVPASNDRFVQCGALTLDLYARRATVGERAVELPPTSFDYLLVLARHSPNLVDYKTLVAEAQGYETDTREAQELTKWHVHHIRQAIEPDPRKPVYIINVRGTGYRLVMG